MKDISLLVDSRDIGGIESHIEQLYIALINSGENVEIIQYQSYGKHPLFSKPLLNAKTLNGSITVLYKYLKSKNTIIHTHGYKMGIIGRLIGSVLDRTVVSTFHNGDPGTGKVKLYNWIDKATSFLSKNICVSAQIANQNICAPQIIPNFVNQPEIVCWHKRKIIAFVGRLSLEKAPDIFCQLKSPLTQSPTVFGDGPMKKKLHKNFPDILFMGNQNMQDHWQNIDLLVIPSRHEGLPMVALEAMSQGIPVIATRCGGLPELIKAGINGWLVNIDDVKGIQSVIDKWYTMSSAEKVNICDAAVMTITNQYSIDKLIPRILRVYQNSK